MTISQRIFDILEKSGKKQKEMAAFTGISTSAISAWKKNNTSPAAESLSAIADFLGVSIAFLVTGKDERPPADTLSADERELLTYYNVLDDMAKGKVVGRAEVLAELAEEQKPEIVKCVCSSDAAGKPYYIGFIDMAVSAGFGVDLLEQGPTERISIARSDTAEKADFALRVSGDSMEPMYHDGDLVLVQSCDCIDDGQVGIFAVNGKGYIKEQQRRKLVSKNRDYEDIHLHEDDCVRCFGLVVGTV